MKHPKFSLVLIGLGIVLLATGVMLKTAHDQEVANNKPTEVKEQSIPLSAEDFDAEDPRIQGAVQQQIQQQEGSVQTTGREGSNAATSQLLQPAPKGLQSQPQE
ncbi:MAG TPA: hypothetical protein VLA88_04240 [Candidatus Saccharimonadales bacterium]|nr:hypothetical protein [Candidatus Saccharimonadales bacterium]